MSGTEVRLSQLLNPRTGRGVIVAFDHGGNGAVAGGEDVPAMLRTLCSSPAEAVLVGPGLARHATRELRHPGAPRLIVALDLCVIDTLPGSDGPMVQHRQLVTPEEALRLGATAAKMLLPVGLPDVADFAASAALIGAAAQRCAAIGLPLMVEPALWGPRVPTDQDKLIADAARVSVELGADLLKIPATTDPVLLKDIISWSPVPVYVLGGAPADPRVLADDVMAWMRAGAAGVAVGRNVWSRPSPGEAVLALQSAVHDSDVDACVRHFESALS